MKFRLPSLFPAAAQMDTKEKSAPAESTLSNDDEKRVDDTNSGIHTKEDITTSGESDKSSENADISNFQKGVKDAQIALQVWTKTHLIIGYAL